MGFVEDADFALINVPNTEQETIVKYFIKMGANVNSVDVNGYNCLRKARSLINGEEIVNLLLQAGAR